MFKYVGGNAKLTVQRKEILKDTIKLYSFYKMIDKDMEMIEKHEKSDKKTREFFANQLQRDMDDMEEWLNEEVEVFY